MKTQLTLILLLYATTACFSQNHLLMREKSKVLLNDKAKFNTIYYVPKNNTKDSLAIKEVIKNAKGDTISIAYNVVKSNILKPIVFDTTIQDNKGFTDKKIKADLVCKEGRIYIHPNYYSDKNDENSKKANKFVSENELFIKMEDRVNYSFFNSYWQVGLLTIPVKWYMKPELGNVSSDVNAMMNIGWNFGKKRFVKLPHEEEARVYRSNFSLNGIFGLSKISLNSKNTFTNNTVEGDVSAFSIGGSIGYHYRGFNFMLVSGIDMPFAERDKWKFSNTPWLGLGIGFDLIKFN